MVSIRDIKRYCDEIAALIKPRRIILFGSHAYGRPHPNSDVDVLVVLPASRRVGRHAAADIRMKVRCDFPVDMLVRGEKEVARRVKAQELFILDITEKGRVMYEAVNT